MKKLDAVQVHWASSFGMGLFQSTIYTLNLVYHATVVGLNPLQMVLVGTTLEATVFLFEVPTGVVADVYSRRLSVVIGFFVIGAGHLIEGAFPTFGAVLLAQVVWGLGWTFISGARSAWITDEVGVEQVAPVYLRATQFYQVGIMAGIPLSVALGSVRLNLPILVGGSLSLAVGVGLALFMPETGFTRAPPGERETWATMAATLRDGLGLVRDRPALLSFVAIGLIIGLSSEGYDRLWTPHMLQDFRFPTSGRLNVETWFGLMRGGSLLLTLAATELARRRLHAAGAPDVGRALQAIYGVMVAAMLLFALTRHLALAIAAYWLVGTLRQTAGPMNEAWINRYIDSRVRATVLSMTGQVDAVGQVVGGPAVGAIGTAVSLRAALAASSFILSPVIALYGRTRKTGAP